MNRFFFLSLWWTGPASSKPLDLRSNGCVLFWFYSLTDLYARLFIFIAVCCFLQPSDRRSDGPCLLAWLFFLWFNSDGCDLSFWDQIWAPGSIRRLRLYQKLWAMILWSFRPIFLFITSFLSLYFHYLHTIFYHLCIVFLLKLSSLLPLKNHKNIFYLLLLVFMSYHHCLFIWLLFLPYCFIIIHTFMHYFCSLAFYIFIIIFSVYLGFNVI